MDVSGIPMTGAAARQTTLRQGWVIRATHALAWLYWAAIMTQIFFAGATIFAGRGWRDMHVTLGYWLPVIPLTMVALCFAGRLPRQAKVMTALLTIMTIIQPYFLYLREVNPLIGALHPLNAMFIFALAGNTLSRVRRGWEA